MYVSSVWKYLNNGDIVVIGTGSEFGVLGSIAVSATMC